MVSFSCEACGDVLTKKKLDSHRNQCYGASFTCLDCMQHFAGTSYKSHTACISEDQKYQGKLYKEKKPKIQHQKKDSAQQDDSQALASYIEKVVDTDNAIAVVDAPPRAPTPPPAPRSLGYYEQATLEAPNVFDFLDTSQTPTSARAPPPFIEARMIEDSQPPAYEEHEEQFMPSIADVMQFQVQDDDESFEQNGFTYGQEPILPSKERHHSFTTPAPKPKHSRTKSRDTDVETTSKKDRKRKRNSPASLDMHVIRAQQERDVLMVDAPPMLHSGLTGGLNRLLTRPEFPPSPEDSGDYANSPLSPMKRAKQGNSKALQRAQKEWELQAEKQRRASLKDEKVRELAEKKEKERGRDRDRDRKERKSSTTLMKVRPKKKREESAKEAKRQRRRQYSSSVSPAPEERNPMKAIEYPRSGSVSPAPDGNGQLIIRPTGELSPVKTVNDPRAELFMSFITKGPESERGMSVNKALKRYHRERFERERPATKMDEEKELWRNMRLKKNDRGEIVLFFAPPDTL